MRSPAGTRGLSVAVTKYKILSISGSYGAGMRVSETDRVAPDGNSFEWPVAGGYYLIPAGYGVAFLPGHKEEATKALYHYCHNSLEENIMRMKKEQSDLRAALGILEPTN